MTPTQAPRKRRLKGQPCPIGSMEIAELLGVKNTAVQQWRHRRLLPEPDYERVNGRPAWERETIILWAGETGRLRPEQVKAFPAREPLIKEFRRITGGDPLMKRPGKGGVPKRPKLPPELVAEREELGRIRDPREVLDEALAALRAQREARAKRARRRTNPPRG